MFESVEHIVFGMGDILFKGVPRKGAKTRTILPASYGQEGYYGSQFNKDFKAMKHFKNKFDLKLYESNVDGSFIYCLSKENPKDSLPFGELYPHFSQNIDFQEIEGIDHSVDGYFVAYNKKESKFKITDIKDDENMLLFSKLYSVIEIIDNSSAKDSKFIKEYNRMIKEEINRIFEK